MTSPVQRGQSQSTRLAPKRSLRVAFTDTQHQTGIFVHPEEAKVPGASLHQNIDRTSCDECHSQQ
jgi:hypothetical protein